MNELIINDVPIRFPFEPYDVQKNYMQKVIECLQKGENGILESPTGTGKTLCLLCASLAWLELKKAEHRTKTLSASMDPNFDQGMLASVSTQLQTAVGNLWKQGSSCPKIIYSSRTHSQLSQVVNELKRTTYSHMKVSVLGSRDQMCVHPEVSKETNNMTKVHMCQIRVKGRNCYFYNQVESKKLDTEVRNNILDLEDLVKLGKKRTFCPYYMAREIRQEADIIFLPYNYLLDPKSRRAHGIELQGNVVIFDEAHNVEKMCEESASLQIRSTDLALCIDEITHMMQKLQELTESNLGLSENALLPEDFSAEDLYILKTIFLELEKAVDEITLPSDGSGVTYPGSFMFDLLQKAEITPSKKGLILDILEKLTQYLTTNSSSPFQRKGAGLQKFSELIKIVFSKDSFSVSHMEFVKQCYKVHVNVEEKRKTFGKDGWNVPKANPLGSKVGKVISYWCFNPGFGMKDLCDQGIYCTILTSGTLSPLESFTSELQIPFPIRLENPHIIQPCQVWVGTICKGPDGNVLNSSYQNRSKPEYMTSLGLTIMNFSRIIPGGLLVFFSSYPIMKMCQEHWQNTGLWTGIFNAKPVFVEPQTKNGFLEAMEEFYAKVRDPSLKGACFLAVCRGKVSEGLDFSDRNGRAVIITGLPYPPFKDPRVVLKQKYLEEVRAKTKKGLTGASWYKLEASRAVNQAVGRVIRHKDDFGAIILCDKRFGDLGFKNELSSWVRPYMKSHEKFGSALKEIIQFFRVTKAMFPESDKAVKESKSSITLAYENESSTSGAPVSANAFESMVGRLVDGNQRCQGNIPPENKVEPADSDLCKNYKSQQTSKSNSAPSEPKPLFAALNENVSVIDFNSVPVMDKHKLKDSACTVPKRKRIKIISESDKNLDSFLNSNIPLSSDASKNCEHFPSSSTHPPNFRNETSSSEQKQSAVKEKGETDAIKHAKVQKYLKEVKAVLSSDDYKIFSNAIKVYKHSSDLDSMLSTLLLLFESDAAKRPFVLKFNVFLRPDHRKQLEPFFRDFISKDSL